jgi:hypothetical protein
MVITGGDLISPHLPMLVRFDSLEAILGAEGRRNHVLEVGYVLAVFTGTSPYGGGAGGRNEWVDRDRYVV